MFFSGISLAAPYAALVMDARTGEVLHSRNADTRLHPASLTKMMTLYMTFKAVESGQLHLDQKIKVTKHAASEPPSRLGLKAGMKISVRHLIRAAAVKSANDAATLLGEAIAGSEANFAKRMTAQAKALGMSKTSFKNAHGLTSSGHMSTARDMALLGRRIMYDFPDYYNLFSRRNADAGLRVVPNTNRKLLANYRGADGIKTGYTNAAGFNLVASAQRGNKRVIVAMFGGRSSATRNARVAELLDMGFNRVPNRYASNAMPATPTRGARLAAAAPVPDSLTLKAPRAPSFASRPKSRPAFDDGPLLVASASQDDLEAQILAAAQAQANSAAKLAAKAEQEVAVAPAKRPELHANNSAQAALDTETAIVNSVALVSATAGYIEPEPEVRRIVTRQTGAQGGGWSVQLGAYGSRYKAEKILLRTALADLQALSGALRKISPAQIDGRTMYRARFVGISSGSAQRACARLNARNQPCTAIGPGA
ncbi:D-alanyl-D-alanine carboxypeptidase [Amylibacter marinus]|nr:D-alanyl-D-alanine carboxypeptidase [Amylibacter marinus]